MDDSCYVCTVRISFQGSKQSQHMTITDLCVFPLFKDRIRFHWAFSIYKKNRKIYIGNFRLGRARSICHKFHSREGRSGRSKDRERCGTSDKDEKSVRNWNTNFHWEVSTRKTGLPFQEFRLFRKSSSGTNQKVMFHLHPNRNFRIFWKMENSHYDLQKKILSVCRINN